MSRVDETGTVHPTDDDPVSPGAMTHLAHCFECNVFALPAQHNITSPCHGKPVFIVNLAHSNGVEVQCTEVGCYNSWNRYGEPE